MESKKEIETHLEIRTENDIEIENKLVEKELPVDNESSVEKELIAEKQQTCEQKLKDEKDLSILNEDQNKFEAESIIKNDKMQEEKEYDHLNPYAYIERDGFTSEIFKIELRGLPKFYGIGQLKKLLNVKLKLGSSKIKQPKKNSTFIYICFRSEQEREHAIKALNGFKWKNSMLSAQAALPAPDPLVRKRKTIEDQNNKNFKKPKLSDSENQISQEERLKDSTIPLWRIPYEEQLDSKQREIESIITTYANNLERINPALKEWLDKQKIINNGFVTLIEKIRASPITEGYRNKCEFSIGLNPETNEKTVGLRLGCYANGLTGVGPIDELIHITKEMKQGVKVIQNFIRQSDWICFNPETHEGIWKQLTIRQSFETNDLMMILGVQAKNLNNEQMNCLKNTLLEYFNDEMKKSILLKSFYIQLMAQKKSGVKDSQNYIHLLGDTHIYDTILNRKFRISPQAFFQINPPGTQILYSSIGSFISSDENLNEVNETTLLDICCGTGAIGLCLADKCNQVLGLEIIDEAIKDAKMNAEINGITNCEYFTGRAEDILYSVACKNKNKNLIAIVDPPRAGLHDKALVALRRTDILDKLIFVSCDPKAAMKNFLDLSRPTSKTFKGYPFLLKKVIGIDLFPNTKHFELILYFERDKPLKENEKEKEES